METWENLCEFLSHAARNQWCILWDRKVITVSEKSHDRRTTAHWPTPFHCWLLVGQAAPVCYTISGGRCFSVENMSSWFRVFPLCFHPGHRAPHPNGSRTRTWQNDLHNLAARENCPRHAADMALPGRHWTSPVPSDFCWKPVETLKLGQQNLLKPSQKSRDIDGRVGSYGLSQAGSNPAGVLIQITTEP